MPADDPHPDHTVTPPTTDMPTAADGDAAHVDPAPSRPDGPPTHEGVPVQGEAVPSEADGAAMAGGATEGAAAVRASVAPIEDDDDDDDEPSIGCFARLVRAILVFLILLLALTLVVIYFLPTSSLPASGGAAPIVNVDPLGWASYWVAFEVNKGLGALPGASNTGCCAQSTAQANITQQTTIIDASAAGAGSATVVVAAGVPVTVTFVITADDPTAYTLLPSQAEIWTVPADTTSGGSQVWSGPIQFSSPTLPATGVITGTCVWNQRVTADGSAAPPGQYSVTASLSFDVSKHADGANELSGAQFQIAAGAP